MAIDAVVARKGKPIAAEGSADHLFFSFFFFVLLLPLRGELRFRGSPPRMG